jgi:hypothetical protein
MDQMADTLRKDIIFIFYFKRQFYFVRLGSTGASKLDPRRFFVISWLMGS